MKKLFNILAAALLVLPLLCGCSEKDNLFPDSYKKVFAFKDNSTIHLSMNTTQEAVVDSLLILRGGGDPESSSTLHMRVMTKAEVCEKWGYAADEIEVIPENSYKFVNGADLSLGKDDAYTYTVVSFNPEAIYEAMQSNTKATYVLPVELTSSTDTINSDLSHVLFTLNVQRPKLQWGNGSNDLQITYQSLDAKIPLEITQSEYNNVDISCILDDSQSASLVKAYNEVQGTDYSVLPAAAYTLDKTVTVKKDSMSAAADLKLSRTGLEEDKTYLLPLKITNLSSVNMQKTDEVCYLKVTAPSVCYEDMDRSKWKIALCNADDRRLKFQCVKMLDGDAATYWNTPWHFQTAVDYKGDDFRYDGITYSSGSNYDVTYYYSFDACRRPGNIVCIIDLGQEETLYGVGVQKPAPVGNDPGFKDTKQVEFYMADAFTFKPYNDGGSIANYNTLNDGNDWHLALTASNIPYNGGPVVWYSTPVANITSGVAKGRYLKVRVTQSYRNTNPCIQIAELYARRVVSIHGKKVE